MQDAARTAYRFVAALFFGALFVQAFLAGLAIFRVHYAAGHGGVRSEKGFENRFDAHMVLGTVLGVVAIVLLLLALAARYGRPRLLQAGGLLVLVIVQILIAGGGPNWFRALHVVNAFLIFALAGLIAHGAWRSARAAA